MAADQISTITVEPPPMESSRKRIRTPIQGPKITSRKRTTNDIKKNTNKIGLVLVGEPRTFAPGHKHFSS